MLEQTALMLKEAFPEVTKVGLMSTTGTRQTGVYRELLEPMGYTVLEVEEAVQEELHGSIYNTEWGIKAVTPCTEKARNNFMRYTELLAQQGAEAVILGCTEIPLALPEATLEFTGRVIPLVDPVA